MTSYVGKLLLFGEYVTIRGSQALALPLLEYKGEWVMNKEASSHYPSLLPFIHFLEEAQNAQKLGAQLDFQRFKKEVIEGLYFKSDIPMGYGAGSSGALCAAVYDRFAYAPISRSDKEHFFLLKKELASLEAYFHGSSSGTDPLICYLNRPVLLEPSGHIRLVTPVLDKKRLGHFFLVDTGKARQTAPLVELFMQKCENKHFSDGLNKELVIYNEGAITGYIQGARHRLMSYLLAISTFQFLHFEEMIPNDFKDLWKLGIDTEQFAIKLCGAGGGGFLLGYTLSIPDTLPLKDYKIITLDI